jgi:hypothetical protein
VIHVHGITHADATLPEALEGLGQRPVRMVVEEDLAAVVSELEEPPRSRDDLDRHARVQSAVVAGATLVPLRFGTLLDDEQELRRDFLGRHAPELRDLLASVEGRVQMSLRAFYREDVLLRETVQAHPQLKREVDRRGSDREARIRLGERIAGLVEERRFSDEAAIVGRLEPHAEHIVVEEPGHERMAAKLQLLVPRDRRSGLDAAVAALAAEQEARMAIRYVGPLPPYSFCDLTLDG